MSVPLPRSLRAFHSLHFQYFLLHHFGSFHCFFAKFGAAMYWLANAHAYTRRVFCSRSSPPFSIHRCNSVAPSRSEVTDLRLCGSVPLGRSSDDGGGAASGGGSIHCCVFCVLQNKIPNGEAVRCRMIERKRRRNALAPRAFVPRQPVHAAPR